MKCERDLEDVLPSLSQAALRLWYGPRGRRGR